MGSGRLDWKKPVPLWSLLVGISLAVSLTIALLAVPALLAPKPDFSLSLKTNSMSMNAFNCYGGTSPCNGNSTLLSLKPLENFTGVVTLDATASNPGIEVTVGNQEGPLTLPTNVLLGAATDLNLGVQSATIGNYTITVAASSGQIVHTLIAPVAVQNITFTLSATSLTVARGSTGTLQMDMASVNRLEGNLTMKGIVHLGSFGGTDPNTSISFSPPSVILEPGGSASTTITLSVGSSAATGVRGVTLTVNKGSYIFNLTIYLTVV
jgi:hypothetical protein